MDTDKGYSRELTEHLESPSEFERGLFTEVIRRIDFVREEGFVIKPTRWVDWLAPALTAAVIVTVYYTYVFPRF